MNSKKRMQEGSLSLLALILACCIIGCSLADEPEARLLTEVIEPCYPIRGSDVDPCGDRPSEKGASLAGGSGYGPAFSIEEILMGSGMVDAAAHLALRGTVIPSSSRCKLYPVEFFSIFDIDTNEDVDQILLCHVNLRVNEYLIGAGESQLNVIVATAPFPKSFTETSPEAVPEAVRRLTANAAEIFEGRELVMFIAPSSLVAVEGWMSTFKQALLRNPEGEIVIYEPYSDPPTLMRVSEFKTVLQEAHNSRLVKTAGRISEREGFPALVTHTTELTEYFTSLQAYDHPVVTPAPPPPVE